MNSLRSRYRSAADRLLDDLDLAVSTVSRYSMIDANTTRRRTCHSGALTFEIRRAAPDLEAEPARARRTPSRGAAIHAACAAAEHEEQHEDRNRGEHFRQRGLPATVLLFFHIANSHPQANGQLLGSRNVRAGAANPWIDAPNRCID